jgi:hypothetical protein
MWMYAEVVDAAGTVATRAEGHVTQAGDLTSLIGRALDRFHQNYPTKSSLPNPEAATYTVRFGQAAGLEAEQRLSP